MEKKYSIDEILLAVGEIQRKKKEFKLKDNNKTYSKQDSTTIPKHTLKLIEEAEKN